MALDRLMKLAVQIADAIGAAHERGIAHRDLKPRERHGHDRRPGEGSRFRPGEAARRLRDGLHTHSTAPLWELTGEGRIVGTAAYMSPEQAEGRPLDHRTDIFSIGIVLYEMATGARPFAGESVVSVLSAILRDTPRSINDVNPRLPRELSRIIRRCLAKDPDERYQSAKDLRNDLNDLRQDLSSGDMPAPAATAGPRRVGARRQSRRPWRSSLRRSAGSRRAQSHRPPRRCRCSTMQFTFEPGVEASPSISPDGKWVVYHRSSGEHNDVFLQAVGGDRPINLTEGSRVEQLDGGVLARRRKHRVRLEPARRRAVRDGTHRRAGAARQPARLQPRRGRRTASGWSTARRGPATTRTRIPAPVSSGSSSIESGKQRLLVKENAVRPAWSPKNDLIAYWGIDPATHYREIWAGAGVRRIADAPDPGRARRQQPDVVPRRTLRVLRERSRRTAQSVAHRGRWQRAGRRRARAGDDTGAVGGSADAFARWQPAGLQHHAVGRAGARVPARYARRRAHGTADVAGGRTASLGGRERVTATDAGSR